MVSDSQLIVAIIILVSLRVLFSSIHLVLNELFKCVAPSDVCLWIHQPRAILVPPLQ